MRSRDNHTNAFSACSCLYLLNHNYACWTFLCTLAAPNAFFQIHLCSHTLPDLDCPKGANLNTTSASNAILLIHECLSFLFDRCHNSPPHVPLTVGIIAESMIFFRDDITKAIPHISNDAGNVGRSYLSIPQANEDSTSARSLITVS